MTISYTHSPRPQYITYGETYIVTHADGRYTYNHSATIEYENFCREVEESENLQRRQLGPEKPMTAMIWYKRPEVWALLLGVVTLVHSIFVQWLWPLIQMSTPGNSPYAPPHGSSEE
ncbi:hypothetical protein GGR58DRAFT_462583 [Xylaria digitata]|nr:hypothetical protein GGR58DRAFT_462583 [Xylaria digitata]